MVEVTHDEHRSLRLFYRILALVGVTGIAAFTWIHRAASPNAWDPVWQRLLMSAACMVLFLAAGRVSLRALSNIAQAVYFALTFWVIELLVRNSFAHDYTIAAIVVTAGIAGTYRQRRLLLYYQAFTLLGFGAAAWLVPLPEVNLLLYFSYVFVLSLLVHIAVAARIHVDTHVARVTEQLVVEVTHDRLTGLPNRALLQDRLERLLHTARRHPDMRFAVLVIDLDRFQRINDSLGHATGDQLLVEVKNRLTGMLRSEDTLARVGSDEFAVIFPNIRDEEDVLRAAARLRNAVGQITEISGQAVHVGASIGITFGPNSYTEAGQLLRDADLAMHRSKEERLNRPRLFDEQMHRHVVEQLRLESEMRRALEQGEFELHYQPIICFANGRLESFEALLRWRHPDRGLLLPADFLPLAEETGLIVDMGRWALGEACRAHRRWRAASNGAWADKAPAIHVNMSAAHFMAGTLVRDVTGALDEHGDMRLGIEIAESVLLKDPAMAASTLSQLRERGVGVSIDDFGTGYSSLRYLHSLPADVVKIDRSFVERCHEKSGIELIRTIVMLAERLGLATTAEGIETEEQRVLIQRSGATHAQGYLYSRPLPEATALATLSPPPDRFPFRP